MRRLLAEGRKHARAMARAAEAVWRERLGQAALAATHELAATRIQAARRGFVARLAAWRRRFPDAISPALEEIEGGGGWPIGWRFDTRPRTAAMRAAFERECDEAGHSAMRQQHQSRRHRKRGGRRRKAEGGDNGEAAGADSGEDGEADGADGGLGGGCSVRELGRRALFAGLAGRQREVDERAAAEERAFERTQVDVDDLCRRVADFACTDPYLVDDHADGDYKYTDLNNAHAHARARGRRGRVDVGGAGYKPYSLLLRIAKSVIFAL